MSSDEDSAHSEASEEEAQPTQQATAPPLVPDDGDLTWRKPPNYEGPPGYVSAVYTEEAASEFDLDDLQGDDFELWLVRAPVNLKMKHLEGLDIPTAGSSTSFRARKADYRLADALVKADMDSMTALLPRKATDNKFYKFTKPFARKLAVSLIAVDADDQDEREDAPRSIQDQHKQPKMRFHFDTFGQGRDNEADTEPPPIEEVRPKKKRMKAGV